MLSMLTPEERTAVLLTAGMAAAAALTAWAVYPSHPLVLAMALGGLGGLFHEIFQSGGKICVFKRFEDGIYLGSAAGMLLGAAAGGLFAGHLLSTAPAAEAGVGQAAAIAYEAFLAGLGLKGIAEAASGAPTGDEQADPALSASRRAEIEKILEARKNEQRPKEASDE